MQKWLGPSLFGAMVVVAVVRPAVGLNATAGDIRSLALILGGVGWTLRSPQKLRSLSSLYVWLAFIKDQASWEDALRADCRTAPRVRQPVG